MTIITFEIDAGVLTLVVDGPAPPVNVDFTLGDGSMESRLAPDSTSGTEYTYLVPLTEETGIFLAVIDDGTVKIEGVISNLTIPISCLLYKTLCAELDCLLMQEITAIETYVYADNYTKAEQVYARVIAKCVTCATGALPELVEYNIFIINGLKQIV